MPPRMPTANILAEYEKDSPPHRHVASSVNLFILFIIYNYIYLLVLNYKLQIKKHSFIIVMWIG